MEVDSYSVVQRGQTQSDIVGRYIGRAASRVAHIAAVIAAGSAVEFADIRSPTELAVLALSSGRCQESTSHFLEFRSR